MSVVTTQTKTFYLKTGGNILGEVTTKGKGIHVGSYNITFSFSNTEELRDFAYDLLEVASGLEK